MEDADGFLVVLGDGDDFVAGFEAAVGFGGTAGDEADDFGGAVVGAEHGADADEGEFHVDVKIFYAAGREVVAVGVVYLGEGGEVALEEHFLIEGLHGEEELLVFFEDEFFGGE